MPDPDSLTAQIRGAFSKGAVVTEKVNSDNEVEALLDDDAELKLRTPFNVFIGGQILDRGITVPNLIGFYYGVLPKECSRYGVATCPYVWKSTARRFSRY